jgi:hypothetical protein
MHPHPSCLWSPIVAHCRRLCNPCTRRRCPCMSCTLCAPCTHAPASLLRCLGVICAIRAHVVTVVCAICAHVVVAVCAWPARHRRRSCVCIRARVVVVVLCACTARIVVAVVVGIRACLHVVAVVICAALHIAVVVGCIGARRLWVVVVSLGKGGSLGGLTWVLYLSLTPTPPPSSTLFDVLRSFAVIWVVCWRLRLKKLHVTQMSHVTVKTREPAVTGMVLPQVRKRQHHTRTCHTHTCDTAGLPIPVSYTI